MNDSNKKPVTVEALLRLKRVEQPAPEFWEHFDKELRVKQLAAIVEKPRWWRTLPRAYSVLARHPLVIGSAAAVTIAVFSVGEFRGIARVSTVEAPEETAFTAPSVPVRAEGLSSRPGATVAMLASAPASARQTPANELAQAPAPVRQSRSEAPFADDASLSIEKAERLYAMPGSSTVAVNLAAIQAAEPELIRNTLNFAQGFQSPVMERRQVLEPLAQMTSPTDERRARLLSGARPVMASYEGTPSISEDGIANRLSDERVYGTSSRYGVGGDRLSIKF
jgi:hypothetical protein